MNQGSTESVLFSALLLLLAVSLLRDVLLLYIGSKVMCCKHIGATSLIIRFGLKSGVLKEGMKAT